MKFLFTLLQLRADTHGVRNILIFLQKNDEIVLRNMGNDGKKIQYSTGFYETMCMRAEELCGEQRQSQ